MADSVVKGGRSTSSGQVIIDGKNVTPSRAVRPAQAPEDKSCARQIERQTKADPIVERQLPVVTDRSGILEDSIISVPAVTADIIGECGDMDSPVTKQLICSTATSQSYVIPQANDALNRFRTVQNPKTFNACMSAISDEQAAAIANVCSPKPHVKKQGKTKISLADGAIGFANDSDYEACIRENLAKLPRNVPQANSVTKP